MKKITLLFVALVSILVIAGCGNSNERTLTCTSTTSGNNMEVEGKTIYTFKNDKLVNAVWNATIKNITVDNLDSLWPTFKAQLESQNVEINAEGIKRETTADDKNHAFNVKMEVNFEKISNKLISENNLDMYKDKTYDELKKYSEETEKQTCK